ncbi:tetratricopeptide repeat protein 19, mitochondrial isoform X2 [Solea solea]|uniref:tetratricopeptide repeat protein 19, mitochondrial isoform X2 n=1 Tax=Solea solea TaxID=90069 RepID=UPI002729FD02|nr:tetratricopeptide repeat protein 19, mitochondrial isoform X2 [Solea solea]
MAASCVCGSVLNRFRCSAAGLIRISAARSQIKNVIEDTHVTQRQKHSTCWSEVSEHVSRAGGGGGAGGRGGGVLWAALAFSLFSSSDEDHRDEAQRKEDEIILLLKKAKLSVHRGLFDAAAAFLHQAVALAHQTNNNQAIIYSYSLMANLAYVQGQLDNAEKLFKATMNVMLSGGTSQDDNAVIEMSLKLATIYAKQNKAELAEHGFRFCTESLEEKLQKHTEEDESLRKETRLLLGLCLDSRARYRASKLHLKEARDDYETALKICSQEQGEIHPQGRHDDALALVQQAVDLSRSSGHPDQHIVLGNMAGILLHKGRLDDAFQFYHEALSLAQRVGDQDAVDNIQDGLKEVKKRREQETRETKED